MIITAYEATKNLKVSDLRVALVVRANDTNEECYIHFVKPDEVAGAVMGLSASKTVHVAETYLADKFGHKITVDGGIR